MAEGAAEQQPPEEQAMMEPEEQGDAGMGFKMGEWNELIGEDITYKVRTSTRVVGLFVGWVVMC